MTRIRFVIQIPSIYQLVAKLLVAPENLGGFRNRQSIRIGTQLVQPKRQIPLYPEIDPGFHSVRYRAFGQQAVRPQWP